MKSTFNITILTPTQKIKIKDVSFFRGEDESGTFGILANHIEFITVLTQSIAIVKKKEIEEFYAFNKGILRFANNSLTISTREFAKSKNLKELKEIITNRFKKIEESEKVFRQNISKLEKEFMKKMIEMEKEIER